MIIFITYSLSNTWNGVIENGDNYSGDTLGSLRICLDEINFHFLNKTRRFLISSSVRNMKGVVD